MYHKMKLIFASIVFIVVSNLSYAATDTTATRILNDLQKKFSAAKGIQAAFTLNQKDKNGKTTGIQKGNVAIKGNKYYVGEHFYGEYVGLRPQVKEGNYELYFSKTRLLTINQKT